MQTLSKPEILDSLNAEKRRNKMLMEEIAALKAENEILKSRLNAPAVNNSIVDNQIDIIQTDITNLAKEAKKMHTCLKRVIDGRKRKCK